jgi:hypothetical protein
MRRTRRFGDEGLPFIPPDQRKAGMGDEGLPLKKGGKGKGDEGKKKKPFRPFSSQNKMKGKK